VLSSWRSCNHLFSKKLLPLFSSGHFNRVPYIPHSSALRRGHPSFITRHITTLISDISNPNHAVPFQSFALQQSIYNFVSNSCFIIPISLLYCWKFKSSGVLKNVVWGRWLPTFRRNVIPSCSGVSNPIFVNYIPKNLNCCILIRVGHKLWLHCGILQVQHFCLAKEGTTLSPCCKEGRSPVARHHS